jgi:hypothetical protein
MKDHFKGLELSGGSQELLKKPRYIEQHSELVSLQICKKSVAIGMEDAILYANASNSIPMLL